MSYTNFLCPFLTTNNNAFLVALFFTIDKTQSHLLSSLVLLPRPVFRARKRPGSPTKWETQAYMHTKTRWCDFTKMFCPFHFLWPFGLFLVFRHGRVAHLCFFKSVLHVTASTLCSISENRGMVKVLKCNERPVLIS